MIRSIEDLELLLPQLLAGNADLRQCLPQASVVKVVHGDGRKVRKDTLVENWNPIGCQIVIDLGAIVSPVQAAQPQPQVPPRIAVPTPITTEPVTSSDIVRLELIRALDEADRDPAHEFVSLKWFRDSYLLQKGFAWTADPATRQAELAAAIEAGLILTQKRANPKTPQFPTTTIRPNRLDALVRSILGPNAQGRFAPRAMAGEPLSQTILGGRR